MNLQDMLKKSSVFTIPFYINVEF